MNFQNLCINWQILIIIWRIEHGSDREAFRFSIFKNNKCTTEEYNFRDLFTIDSQKIFKLIRAKKYIDPEKIKKLAIDTNISRSVFEGTKLIVQNPDEELGKAFTKYAIARIRGDKSYRNELSKIIIYIKKCRENLNQGISIDPELYKAFIYIRGESSLNNSQQNILNITNLLNDIKYKELLASDPHNLFKYLKAIRKQEKLVTTAIIHNSQIR